MDAPGATSPDESAVGRTPTDTLRSGSSTHTTQGTRDQSSRQSHSSSSNGDEDDEEVDDDEEEDSDEEEEPRLKYAYLTKHLGSVYRNGDATSSFLVAGDKMVCLISWSLDKEG